MKQGDACGLLTLAIVVVLVIAAMGWMMANNPLRQPVRGIPARAHLPTPN